MAFKSQDSYFKFAESVLQRARYIYTGEAQEFLADVRETARQREIEIPGGTSLWRAQTGQDRKDIYTADGKISLPVNVAYPPERMHPRKERASEGRVNPKGIPCLYLATAPATAVAEVRPPLGAWVSVGSTT